jgi:type IV pilus assembly protein PilA
MPSRPKHTLGEERGFTLVELLITILIIGILAAIALPAFLSYREKGQDADAKSNARNLVTDVEVCFTGEQDFQECRVQSGHFDTSLPFGTSPGQVTVAGATQNTYTLVATSKADSGGANHTFTLQKNGAGVARDCTPVGKGGCPDSGAW